MNHPYRAPIVIESLRRTWPEKPCFIRSLTVVVLAISMIGAALDVMVSDRLRDEAYHQRDWWRAKVIDIQSQQLVTTQEVKPGQIACSCQPLESRFAWCWVWPTDAGACP